MIFATVCIGEDRRSDLMHLLNDLRNLNFKVFVLTNIDLHLEHFQFHNVFVKKININYWTDFQRFEIIKHAFEEIDENYVYYLDCDSRFIDCREEKFNVLKFENLLSKTDFDIICPLFLSKVKNQLEKPKKDEDKKIRNFNFGYDVVIDYFKKSNKNYDLDIHNTTPLETVLIFRKSEKMLNYLNELINFSTILISEDTKNQRIHIASACGFAMAFFKNVFEIKIIENPIVYHFFKGNFLREVFPFNNKINTSEKVF